MGWRRAVDIAGVAAILAAAIVLTILLLIAGHALARSEEHTSELQSPVHLPLHDALPILRVRPPAPAVLLGHLERARHRHARLGDALHLPDVTRWAGDARLISLASPRSSLRRSSLRSCS